LRKVTTFAATKGLIAAMVQVSRILYRQPTEASCGSSSTTIGPNYLIIIPSEAYRIDDYLGRSHSQSVARAADPTPGDRIVHLHLAMAQDIREKR
jgi:hypothetical protein